jgi:cytochrome c-type biogenesis protein CcmH
MLGNLEADQGDFAAAADAWRRALAVKFDPLLAAQVADAASRAEGRVSPESAELFRQALANAPPDAPWRGEVEQRLAQAQGSAKVSN